MLKTFGTIEAPEINNGGDVGCARSHLAVLKLARERNYENILILEDDFMFCVSKNGFEKQLTNFYNSKINFDVCMLSYHLTKSEDINFEIMGLPQIIFIGRVINAQSAADYLINKHYYDKLIELYEFAIPLLASTRKHWIYACDMIWHQLQEKDRWYYFKNRIGKQRNGYSDIGQKMVIYER